MREVEAQLVGSHVRARLAHVRAEFLAQRRVQEVRGSVVRHRGEPRLAVHERASRLADLELAVRELERHRLVVANPVDAGHLRAPGRRLNHPAVRRLPTALRVEGALRQLGEVAPVLALERSDRGLPLGGLIAHETAVETRRARELEHPLMPHVGALAAARARHLARLLHQLSEAVVVHRQALLREQLLRQFVREAIGVMQPERVLGVHPRGFGLLRAHGDLGQEPLALRERAAEALLLGAGPLLDRVALALELRVGVAHRLDHRVAQLHEEALLDAELAALLDGAAHHAPEHVAALLVRRDHPVREQERHPPPVVGDEPQRPRHVGALPHLAAGERFAELDHRHEPVGLEHGRHALLDRRHSLEAEARVDVLLGQLRDRAVLVEEQLHEHQVPVLEEALGVVARPVLLAAEVEAAVEVELRAGPAGTGRPRLPEVVVTPQQDDAVIRHADGPPARDGLVIGPDAELLIAAEHRHPDLLRVEAEALGRQLPRGIDGALLEVVAEREVAEHLEEREVPLGQADVLDVGGAENLLAGREPDVRRLLLATEVRLEGLHAGGRQQHRRVVRGWHERGGGHAHVIPALEKGPDFLPNLRRLHGSQSSYPAPACSPQFATLCGR